MPTIKNNVKQVAEQKGFSIISLRNAINEKYPSESKHYDTVKRYWEATIKSADLKMLAMLCDVLEVKNTNDLFQFTA